MQNTHKSKIELFSLERYIWVLVIAWTVTVAGLLAWSAVQTRLRIREMAVNEARANFNKDQAFRFWATSHGGVYVPVDEKTPPNPYLSNIPERDIETPAGQHLTLMNPAYMLRQMNEEFSDLYGVAGHITSLNPLRPENAPDEWERRALEAFEQGETEVLEFTEMDGEPYLRLMQPMITQEGCLKCHAHQGYRVGDVRGGVGVSLPMDSLLTRERQIIIVQGLSLGLVWLLGLGGIGLGSRETLWRVRERKRAEKALESVNLELQTALAREKQLARTDSLTGVNNRRHLYELAEHEIEVAVRYQQPLAVIMFDIDHFKKVNDIFGHLAGDQILEHVAQTACAQLRSADRIGRYGGEEFIILLPMTNAQQACLLAERIRLEVEALRVPTSKGDASVTLSIGVIELIHGRPSESVEEIFRRVDNAMYRAKQDGRNCTVILTSE
ncbi:MAG: diguanylate cyclase [Chloroflexi bacterium]|nr:diguanylate cyclase [Chloroflexota bacterium]